MASSFYGETHPRVAAVANNLGRVHTEPSAMHGHAQSLTLTLPPLAAVFLVNEA